MNQVFFTNPMAQGLNEFKRTVKTKEQIEEAKDHNGDTWKLLKDVVRNESHPRYLKQPLGNKHDMKHNVWHNTRTGECHEGAMRHDLSGHVSPEGDMYGQTGTTSRMFHRSHYSKAVHEESEVNELSKPLLKRYIKGRLKSAEKQASTTGWGTGKGQTNKAEKYIPRAVHRIGGKYYPKHAMKTSFGGHRVYHPKYR